MSRLPSLIKVGMLSVTCRGGLRAPVLGIIQEKSGKAKTDRMLALDSIKRR